MLYRSQQSSTRKVLHSKFVIRRKRDLMGSIIEQKTGIVVYGNEVVENGEESFSLFPFLPESS